MSSQLSAQDREQINAGIREKYNKVAITTEGHFFIDKETSLLYYSTSHLNN